MKLYTTKVLAEWLGMTERRVRMLRDEGVIDEIQPGLYNLQASVKKYIAFLKSGVGKETLNDERARLVKAKREAAEMENEVLRGNLHRTEDVELGLKTAILNIRSRFLSLPAKLAPTVADLGGDKAAIYDVLQRNINEVLEELSDFRNVLTAPEPEEGDGDETD